LVLVNATFSNRYNLNWALVYVEGKKSNACIVNTTFENINAKYTPAIYFDSARGTVSNCIFKNLSAELTGGA
ncbi:MAG: hypothetical protein BZ135_03225, partial [Methanosphaera sp. rholeuAM6]